MLPPVILAIRGAYRWGKTMFEKLKEKVSENKARISMLFITLVGLISGVSAVDLSGITDLIDEIVLLMPAVVAMVIAAIPIIVVIALAAFIVGFLENIVRKIG